ncbi:LTA synthase family protein [Seongchinamella unica]|uniref:LTA synthase family protein n=1 Tax=Seongchinamella unica TaxID=2547392 RepID=A0A4R5LND5_9GAMM|nr:LTA synthase family protein [Seongchinamella unica]TDG11859.1 LTA synthase family protein [Seongchinamella unica]
MSVQSKSFYGAFKSCVIFFLAVLAVATCSRLVLSGLYWDRLSSTGMPWSVFLQGLRFDIILASALTVVPAALVPWMSGSARAMRVVNVYFLVCFALVLFMEAASPTFIAEYDARPNRLFIEYLRYPKEVFSMLWVGYRIQVAVGLMVVGLATVVFRRLMLATDSVAVNRGIPVKLALSLVILLAGVVGIRSSFGHRPANPSVVAFSNDMLVNDLALNSSYSLAYAVYSNQRHERGVKAYGRKPWDSVVREVRQSMHLDQQAFISAELPTLHVSDWVQPRPHHPNIVIILEESLGAEYVGSLGGIGVTPRLDALTTEGIWFEQLYATGTRSVRGIEAVITGFTPTPARSVVKLPKSQTGFFTLAQLLHKYDYDTSFIYGGEAHFDNMRQFFMGNGFDRVVEQKDYPSPEFVASWGVSDEDLFKRAHAEFAAMARQGQPFFSLVFTSSNHSPFEFPDDRIELHEQPKASVNNAVKYADFALGRYFDQAKASNYWEDTIFLVVADHNSRVRGADRVPVESFHIPALILGGAIEPRIISRQASQIDLLPTLLHIAGIASPHPAIGQDLLRPDIDQIPGRAIMQYGGVQAYMEGERIVILAPEQAAQMFGYRKADGYVDPEFIDEALIDRVLAQSIWSVEAYQQSLYRLPSG